MAIEIDEMIELNSDVRNIPKVEAFVEDVVEKFDVAPEIYGNILISLTEAVTNAIVHGNDKDMSKKVKVKMEKEAKKLTFKVTDEGGGFDFSMLPDPTAPENLLKIGGRGVFMMRQLSDILVFSNNGSTVEMIFKV
ncbi:MAG: serine/threonine-protein kinase RsbW [Maribacter sp.]|jgi:serine/threonine-protein kinase RsbW